MGGKRETARWRVQQNEELSALTVYTVGTNPRAGRRALEQVLAAMPLRQIRVPEAQRLTVRTARRLRGEAGQRYSSSRRVQTFPPRTTRETLR